MLIFHIGRHKTGTSSIQHFLHAQRSLLQKHGILYPDPIGGTVAHHGIALALKRGEDASAYRELLLRLDPRANNILISSEAFQGLKIRNLRDFVEGIPVSAIAYLREQFNYAWSAYGQRVMVGKDKRPFGKFLPTFQPDYPAYLATWREATGNRVTARIFDRNKLVAGDVVVDLLNTLGVPYDQFPQAKPVGVSYGWRALVFLQRLNKQLASNPELADVRLDVHRGLRRVLNKFPELKEKPIFPAAMIADFQAGFAEQNRAVAADYFGLSGEELFDLTWTGDSEYDPDVQIPADFIEALCAERSGLQPHAALLNSLARGTQ